MSDIDRNSTMNDMSMSEDFMSTGSTSDNQSDSFEVFELADLRDTVINKVKSQGGVMGMPVD